MKRIVVVGIVCAIAGIAAGAAFMARSLMEPLDLLALPYRNEPHNTREPMTLVIESTGETFELPAGTPLVYRHDVKGQPHLALLMVGEPGEPIPLRPADSVESLYVRATDQR